MFNEYLGCIDGQWVIYNNLSSAMIEIPENIYAALENSQLDSLSPKNINALSQARFIVEGDKHEIDDLREKKKEIQENSAVLGLQILPTSACNFCCDYCFEKSENSGEHMSREIMDKIVSWAANSIKPTTRVLNVMWFGGEPLTAVEQIKYLSKALLEITTDKNITYYSNIITNGYFLNDKNVDMLLENQVKSCMVTIDGPEDIHDNRRKLKNGGKTWRIIIDNVKSAVDKGMSVTIRINVDKSNIDSIDRLFGNLEELNVLNEVGYFFGVITSFGSACSSIEDRLLSMEETYRILKQKRVTDTLSHSNNFKYRIPADLVGCVASARHSYVVAPNGELYKCTKTIGDPAEMCGNIENPDSTHTNFVKWLDLDNFYDKFCSSCSMVPVCRGKICAFDVMNNSEKYERCNYEEDHRQYLDRLIKLYRNKKSGQINHQKSKQEDLNE
jgi:uncharacterized protein